MPKRKLERPARGTMLRVISCGLVVAALTHAGEAVHAGEPLNFPTPLSPDLPYQRRGFAVSISTIGAAVAVSVRFRIVGEAKFGRSEIPLLKTKQNDQEGRAIWSVGGVTVPHDSTVQFKVFYWIGGLRYKDDNGGRYYLAPQPPAEEAVSSGSSCASRSEYPC
jgi:hypothetical protein